MSIYTKINKLNKVQLDTQLVEVGIPEPKDVGSILHCIPDDWWTFDEHLLQSGVAEYAEFSNGTTAYTQTYQLDAIKGIRPIITIKPTPETKRGDVILVGERWLFIMISETQALCDTVIGYGPFSDGLCTYIGDSLVMKQINDWAISIKTLPIYTIYREEATVLSLDEEDIGLPGASVGAFLRYANYPFWTRNLQDEFTGKYLEKKGDPRMAEFCRTKTARGKLINICPNFYFNAIDKGFNLGDIFSCCGRVFQVTYAEEAICLNTIGVSCFSNGFCVDSTGPAQTEFKKDSEAYMLLRKWMNTISNN